MKHTIEVKFPKIFGKKKKVDEPDVKTEVDLEEEFSNLPLPWIVGGTLVVGLTIGYLVGHRNGVMKGGNVFVFKD